MSRVRSRPHTRTMNWTDQYALHLIKKIPEFTIDYSDPEEHHKVVTLRRLEEEGYVKEDGSKNGLKLLALTDKGTSTYQQLRTQGRAYIDELIINPLFSITSRGRVPVKHVEFWEWVDSVAPEHTKALKQMSEYLGVSNITFLTIFTEFHADMVQVELEDFYDCNRSLCDDLLARVPEGKMQELHDYFLSLECLNNHRVSELSEGFVKARYILQVGREAESIWKNYAKWNDHARPFTTSWLI